MYIRNFLFFVLLILAFQTSYAQTLQRKGGLGIMLDNAPLSFFDRYGWATTKGVVVTKVTPNTSASSMGLVEGDVLVELNGKPITDVSSFYTLSSKINAKEQVKLKVLRRSSAEIIIGELAGKTDESSPSGEVFYEEVSYESSTLRSLIHKPQGEGKFPAIYILPNFPCTSIDYATLPDHPMKQLIDGWVSAGFVVYRMERPGVGDSEGPKKCEQLSFDEEVVIYGTGLKALKRYPYVDSAQVYLFGQGTGGMTAAWVASQQNIKGLMVYGTFLKPWMSHILDQHKWESALKNEDPIRSDEDERKMLPLLADWLLAGKTDREMNQNEAYKNFLARSDNPLHYSSGTFSGRSPRYFYHINQKAWGNIWKSLTIPVIVIAGELDTDIQTPSESEKIFKIIQTHHNGNGTFQMLPNTEQNMVRVPSREEHAAMVKNGSFGMGYMGKNFNTDMIGITVEWMKLRK